MLIDSLFKIYENIPFEALNYLISIIVYGGHITDEWDSYTLQHTFKKFVNENSMENRF
jgi:hypothetical protein